MRVLNHEELHFLLLSSIIMGNLSFVVNSALVCQAQGNCCMFYVYC